MPSIDIRIDGTGGAFADLLKHQRVIEVDPLAPIRMETLDHGMESGAPSVAILIDLPQRSALFPPNLVVLAQTSVKLFQMAAYATMAKYGDLTEGAITGFLSRSGKAELTLSVAEKCPQCHTEQPGSNKYCSECGAKL